MTAFRYLNDILQTHKLGDCGVSYRKQEENPFAREVLLDTKRTPINEICAVAELLRRDFCNCCRRYRQGREGLHTDAKPLLYSAPSGNHRSENGTKMNFLWRFQAFHSGQKLS